jgi:hypothetical protein
MPNDSLVRVVDGVTRKVDKPKRKNIRHLVYFNSMSKELAEKFQNGMRVSNADIRKAIQDIGASPKS